jgi:hypothetical protein
VQGGTVNLNSVTLLGNQAVGGNGGADSASRNRHAGWGGDGLGGGLYIADGTVTLTGVIVQSNSTRGGQGGNSTQAGGYAGNGGNAFGGGLYVAGGTASLVGSTVTANSVTNGAGGSGPSRRLNGSPGQGVGGGLYIADALATIAVILDTSTYATITQNTASTSDPSIHGVKGTNYMVI